MISASPNIDSVQLTLQKVSRVDYRDWHDLARSWLTTPGVKESWEALSAMATVLEAAESEV